MRPLGKGLVVMVVKLVMVYWGVEVVRVVWRGWGMWRWGVGGGEGSGDEGEGEGNGEEGKEGRGCVVVFWLGGTYYRGQWMVEDFGGIGVGF